MQRLQKLQQAKELVDAIKGLDLDNSSIIDTNTTFRFKSELAPDKLLATCQELGAFSAISTIRIHFKIEHANASICLVDSDTAMVSTPWTIDPDFSYDLVSGCQTYFDALGSELSKDTPSINVINLMIAKLADFKQPLTVRVEIEAAKRTIDDRVSIYFFSRKFEEEFCRSYKDFYEFEEKWISDPLERSVIFVADLDSAYVTTGILITGNPKEISQISLSQNDNEKIQTAIKFCKEQVNWQNRTKRLTPYLLSRISGSNESLDTVLSEIQSKLSLYFLASVVLREGSVDRLIFSDSNKPFDISPTITGNEKEATLFKLFNWVYTDPSKDKIQIMRRVINSNVSPVDALHSLQKGTDLLLLKAEGAYKDHLVESVEGYFKKVADLNDYISKFTNDSKKEVLTLVKDTTSAFIGTIGIVSGTVLLPFAKLIQMRTASEKADYISFAYWVACVFFILYSIASIYHIAMIKRVASLRSEEANSLLENANLSTKNLAPLRKKVDDFQSFFEFHTNWILGAYIFVLVACMIVLYIFNRRFI